MMNLTLAHRFPIRLCGLVNNLHVLCHLKGARVGWGQTDLIPFLNASNGCKRGMLNVKAVKVSLSYVVVCSTLKSLM